jgi:hypothetical protein
MQNSIVKTIAVLEATIIFALASIIVWQNTNIIPDIPVGVAVREKVRTITKTVTVPGGTTTVTQTVESVPVLLEKKARYHRLNLSLASDAKLVDKAIEVGYDYRLLDHTWVGSAVDTKGRVKVLIGTEF